MVMSPIEQHNLRNHSQRPYRQLTSSVGSWESSKVTTGCSSQLLGGKSLYGNSRITILTIPISSEMTPQLHVESRYLCDMVGERPDSNHLNGLKKPDDAAVYFENRVTFPSRPTLNSQ
jgi:hypothetical protein